MNKLEKWKRARLGLGTRQLSLLGKIAGDYWLDGFGPLLVTRSRTIVALDTMTRRGLFVKASPPGTPVNVGARTKEDYRLTDLGRLAREPRPLDLTPRREPTPYNLALGRSFKWLSGTLRDAVEIIDHHKAAGGSGLFTCPDCLGEPVNPCLACANGRTLTRAQFHTVMNQITAAMLSTEQSTSFYGDGVPF